MFLVETHPIIACYHLRFVTRKFNMLWTGGSATSEPSEVGDGVCVRARLRTGERVCLSSDGRGTGVTLRCVVAPSRNSVFSISLRFFCVRVWPGTEKFRTCFFQSDRLHQGRHVTDALVALTLFNAITYVMFYWSIQSRCPHEGLWLA